MKRLLPPLALTLAFAAPAGARATLDEGRLVSSWFGPDIEFREADEIDYLWVRPGFSLEGKKLRFAPWPEPELVGDKAAERDTKDLRLARQMASTMDEVFAASFANAFKQRIELVDGGEDVLVEGRIVDCSTGAMAAKVLVGFGAGAGSTTIDLKFLDAASGELLLAIHHRSVSGTSWSTTDSKFVDWAEEMAEEGAKKGFEKLYAKGDRVKK
ncbi:MAG TPA: DUF4410 domain-containing protein [Thermoanaerobaculia bacterium]|jgi:hypothetical protein